MTLQELKSYLKITDNKDDAFLELALEAVIDYVKSWTSNDFKNGIPAGVKIGIAMLISTMLSGEGVAGANGSNNIKQEKIDGLQITYFSPAELGEAAEEGGSESIAKKYFLPYRKIRFL